MLASTTLQTRPWVWTHGEQELKTTECPPPKATPTAVEMCVWVSWEGMCTRHSTVPPSEHTTSPTPNTENSRKLIHKDSLYLPTNLLNFPAVWGSHPYGGADECGVLQVICLFIPITDSECPFQLRSLRFLEVRALGQASRSMRHLLESMPSTAMHSQNVFSKLFHVQTGRPARHGHTALQGATRRLQNDLAPQTPNPETPKPAASDSRLQPRQLLDKVWI